MAHVPASERRPQLVRAAIDLMSREGVGAGSTRAVAAELGVAQAMVHYTFGTKRELYRAVIEQLTADFTARVEAAAPSEGPFEEQIAVLVRALWDGVTADTGQYALLSEFAAMALRDPELQQILSRVDEQTEELTCRMLADLAAEHRIDLALPPQRIAAFFLASFSGLADRHQATLVAGIAEAGSAELLDVLIGTVVGLCLGAVIPQR